MLALYDDPSGWKRLSPEECKRPLKSTWLGASGPTSCRVGGDPGRVLKASNGKPRATDGPYSETKEVLGGIYLIEAKDYDEAVERTLDHPHLEHGTIELRQLYTQP